MKNISRSRGFTLIELLVVIAIIGLLASTVLAAMSSARVQARDSARLTQARELMKALEIYRVKNNGYPCSGSANAGTVCAAGVNAANSAVLIPKVGSSVNTNDTLVKNALGWSASTTDSQRSLYYFLRSSTNNNNGADFSGYTILVWQERKDTDNNASDLGDYCRVTTGSADGRTTAATTLFGTVTLLLTKVTPCSIPGIR